MNSRRPGMRPSRGSRSSKPTYSGRGSLASSTSPATSYRHTSTHEKEQDEEHIKETHCEEVDHDDGSIDLTRKVSPRMLGIIVGLAVSIFLLMPTISNYLEQKETLRDAQDKQAAILEHNRQLQKEIELWNDDAYVKNQARSRLGYVLPGETLWVVTDTSEGTARERLQVRVEEVQRARRAAVPWYVTLWSSLEVVGTLEDDGTVDNPDNLPVATPSPSPSSQTPEEPAEKPSDTTTTSQP